MDGWMDEIERDKRKNIWHSGIFPWETTTLSLQFQTLPASAGMSRGHTRPQCSRIPNTLNKPQ